MHARAGERGGVVEGALRSRSRNSSSRPGRQAMPRSPAAKSPGRRVEQHLLQAVARAARAASVAGRPVVGKEVLDRARSRRARRRRSGRGTRCSVYIMLRLAAKRGIAVSSYGVTSGRRTAGAARRSARGDSGARLRLAARARGAPFPRSSSSTRHRRGRRLVPDVRAEPRQHHGADRRAARSPCRRSPAATASPTVGCARPLVGDQRHVADLHHEVRRDRRQQVVARLVAREAQAQRDAVRASGCG